MKKFMMAFSAVLLLAAGTAFADPSVKAPVAPVAVHAPASAPVQSPSGTTLDEKNFEVIKKDALKSIDDMLGQLGKDRKCVAAATTPKAFMDCHKASREARQAAVAAARARAGLPVGPVPAPLPKQDAHK